MLSRNVRTHVARPECTVVSTGGMLIGDSRGHACSGILPELRLAVREALVDHPSGLVGLSIQRVDRRFRLPADYAEDLGEIGQTLGGLRTAFYGIAVVIEFDGLAAGLVRGAIGVFMDLVPDSPPIGLFHRRIDALQWLIPQIRTTSNPALIDHYLAVANRLSRDSGGNQKSLVASGC